MPDDHTSEVVEAPEPTTYTNLDLRQDFERVSVARPLVPTEREIETGEVPAYDFQPYKPEEIKFSTLDAAKDFGKQLNFRELAGEAGVRPLILLGWFHFFNSLLGGALAFLLPDIRNDFGFGIAIFGVIVNMIFYVAFLASPLMGYAADRYNRIYMLTGGSVLASVGAAVMGLATGLPLLIVGEAGVGLGGAMAGPVGLPLLTDFYRPHTRARMFSVIYTAVTLGAVFAPIAGGVMGGFLGWRTTFLILGIGSAAISFAFLLLKDPVRGKLDREAAGLSAEAAAIPQRPLGWAEAWRAAASIKTVRRLWFGVPFLIVAALETPQLINLYYAQQFHIDTLPRGFLVSLGTVPAVFGVMLGGALTDRLLSYKPGRVIALLGFSMILNAAALVVFAYTPFVWLAFVAAIPALMVGAFLQPAVQTVISLVVPARIRGLGLQTITPWLIVGLLIGNLTFAIAGGANDLHNLMIAFGVVIAVGAVIIGSGSGGVEQDIRAAVAASAADIKAQEARTRGVNKMLIVRDVDVTYDGAQVLFGVDLDVEEGEMVALLGTNGAGKSTLLRAISGIQEASNGAIFLEGDDITHMPPHQIAQRGVVMMPGGHAVFPTLTVEQNLKTAAWMFRNDPKYVKEKTEEVLELFPRLRERWTALAGNLSGGEQQMVALGQALLMRPRLLMIDELSLGLAPQVVEQLLQALRKINEQGTTVMVVEQSINVALQVAKRAVYMEKGQIRFDGSVKELFSRPDVVHSVFLAGAAVSGGLAATTERRLLELGLTEKEMTLDVKDLHLHYGGVKVLNGVSLEITRGEVVGIVGPNGAGKTSLFDVITGFAKPDQGEIRFLDQDVTRMAPDARARLGLARSYQNVRLFPALTVRENVAVALERHLQSRNAILAAVWSPMTRRSERRVARRVDNLVESLGLGGYADKFLNELSTGTRRIVDIACLLAAGPSLLLLDEPSSGLAQAETEQLGPVIGRIVKETGCAVLIIEHDLGLVASVSHRLVAMRLGEVMAEGRPADVLGQQEVVDAILGGASQAVVSRSIALAGAESK